MLKMKAFVLQHIEVTFVLQRALEYCGHVCNALTAYSTQKIEREYDGL